MQGDRLGFYSQLGQYGGRPAYRQQGGHQFLFYMEEEQKWVDSRYFFGASLFSKGTDKDNYSVWGDLDVVTIMSG